jgi:polysaccharide export outer membrane protein
MNKRLWLILLLSVSFLILGCSSQKKVIYFQGEIPSMKDADKYRLKIYPGDILSVNIFTINAEAYPYFSVSMDRPMSDTRSAYEKGIVVNDSGQIKLPLIGIVQVNGLTISEASRTIETKLKAYINDPIVTLKKLNFKITVLGEVNKPGTYPILNERVTLPEALGLAGDISQFGDRQKLRIIREENNETKDFFVDLTQAGSIQAETYYLRPDDIVYVQPVKRRAFQNITPGVTIFTSIITTAVIALTFILTQTK